MLMFSFVALLKSFDAYPVGYRTQNRVMPSKRRTTTGRSHPKAVGLHWAKTGGIMMSLLLPQANVFQWGCKYSPHLSFSAS